MRPLRLFLAAVLLAVGSVSASAAPLVIGTTTNAGRWLSDPYYSSLRAALLDPANFGSDGVVDRAVEFASPADTITDEYLSGLDVFFLNEPYNPLLASEVQALKDFVLGGGSLVMVSESGGNSAISAVLAALDGSSLMDAHVGAEGSNVFPVTGSSSLLDGPFGSLAGQALGGSPGAPILLGTHSSAVATYGPAVVVSEIPPDALAPGSGRVLTLGDVLFMNYFVPGHPSAFAPDDENLILALNYFAAVANGGGQVPPVEPGNNVPEPTLVLLLGAGCLVAARRVRR